MADKDAQSNQPTHGERDERMPRAGSRRRARHAASQPEGGAQREGDAQPEGDFCAAAPAPSRRRSAPRAEAAGPSVPARPRARSRQVPPQEPQEAPVKPGLSGKIDSLRGKGVRALAGVSGGKPPKPPRKNRRNPIARVANRWFDRVMGAVKDGGLSGQEEEYAAHKTTRDFVCNTVGVGAWGMVFPVLTMVSTQLVGAEQAGMISMAFVVGTLLMIIANFGVRTYQISDVNEAHSFNDYQVNRWITCAVMVAIGVAYCMVRGYDSTMFYLSMGVFTYKMIDGLADVYEGRLQQVDKLYLAGVSQAFRSMFALIAFTIALLITRDAVISSFAMAIAAAVTFVVVTYPLTLLETPRSRSATASSVFLLFKNTAPLFLALFLYAVIDNMPKFVMESMLSYDNQLYFNALYFPAQGILITAQLVYKPLLVRMAGVWQDTSKRRQFDMILVGILLLIVGITAVNVVVMAWVGIPVMSILYGIDFEQFRQLMYTMLVAGGVTAAIDFLYQVITVMRRQRDVTALYCVTFGFSLFIPMLLVSFTGLPGAILSYLIVMSILFVLLVWEYLRIRRDLARGRRVARGRDAVGRDAGYGHDGAQGRERTTFSACAAAEDEADFASEPDGFARPAEEAPLRPSEIRARREHREEVMRRRTSNRRS